MKQASDLTYFIIGGETRGGEGGGERERGGNRGMCSPPPPPPHTHTHTHLQAVGHGK